MSSEHSVGHDPMHIMPPFSCGYLSRSSKAHGDLSRARSPCGHPLLRGGCRRPAAAQPASSASILRAATEIFYPIIFDGLLLAKNQRKQTEGPQLLVVLRGVVSSRLCCRAAQSADAR